MAQKRQWRSFHIASGMGGCGLGFKLEGFLGAGAVDISESACADYEMLVGEPATCADLSEMQPSDMREIVGPEPPDVVVTSSPCKGFSRCLPVSRSRKKKYVDLNNLAVYSVFLALEAWERKPPIILFENVPGIRTRGRVYLDRVIAMLQGYGYAVTEVVYDCGVLGGLAQHRPRVLLMARDPEQVPCFVRVPPSQRVRGIGEVLELLPQPLPGSKVGGPMHRLPRLIPKNWVRLALIPAGKDWKSIPGAVRLPPRDARQNGLYGVEDWDKPSHAIIANTSARDFWGSVADPRVDCVRQWGGHGVRGWNQPCHSLIAHPTIDNFPVSVADPRLNCAPRNGAYMVKGWAEPSHAVLGNFRHDNSPASVADPRVPEIRGPWFDIESKKPTHMIIRAADGTWHRPMTTLELAALQGFPVRDEETGEWLKLTGNSDRGWRERIGNAIPVPTAQAIARECIKALEAAADGRWPLDNGAIWVREGMMSA